MVWLAAACALLASTITTALAESNTLYERGGDLQARVGGITLTGLNAACIRCHGHPLDGGAEGGVKAPALAWNNLIATTSTRPGYDAESFARALRSGINPAGEPLHALMPRYALTPVQLTELISYLQAPPAMRGVTSDRIRLATVLPAEPALRPAGQASEAALRERINTINQQGGLFGRTLELITLEVGRDTDKLAAQLDKAAVLLVIASVGLQAEGSVADILAELKILNLAPMAALVGDENPRLIKALRPGLLPQAAELARHAQRNHHCLGIDAGDDPISRKVAHHIRAMYPVSADRPDQASTAAAKSVATGTRATSPCPARLILHPIHQARSAVERAQHDGVAAVYLSAEQTGLIPATQARPPPRIIAATGGIGTLDDQARGNALNAMTVLANALRDTGRRVTPGRLNQALERAQAKVRGRVRLLE